MGLGSMGAGNKADGSGTAFLCPGFGGSQKLSANTASAAGIGHGDAHHIDHRRCIKNPIVIDMDISDNVFISNSNEYFIAGTSQNAGQIYGGVGNGIIISHTLRV